MNWPIYDGLAQPHREGDGGYIFIRMRSSGLESERMEPVAASPPIKVAIVGAGRGGTALLDVLHQIGTIEIVGITDKDPRPPGSNVRKNSTYRSTTESPICSRAQGSTL